MNESELRSYIRKEINLTEAAGDFGYSDMTKIWDSFANVFGVAKTALKSLISTLVLTVNLVFSTDAESRKRAKEQYQTRRAHIESEYEKFAGAAKKRLSSLEPMLFLAYPGAYLGYEIVKGGSAGFGDVREFFQQVGIDITSMRLPTYLGGEGGKSDLTAMHGFFGGGTPRTEGALAKIYDQQRKLQNSLDRIFGLAQERMGESVLLEQAESLENQVKSVFTDIIARAPAEAFGLDKDAEKSVVDLKKQQAKKFTDDLEAPLKFMQKLANAKTIEDVKSSLIILRDAPFSLRGIEQLTPEFLESSASKALTAAEKKGKLKELFDQIGIEIPADQKSKIEAVKAYQMKNLLGETVLKVKEELTKQIEALRSEYLEEFTSDVPMDILKEIAPGSELDKVMQDGVQKIKMAGKR